MLQYPVVNSTQANVYFRFILDNSLSLNGVSLVDNVCDLLLWLGNSDSDYIKWKKIKMKNDLKEVGWGCFNIDLK